MKVVSYNIQWGKGRDGRIDLTRIAATVAEADIIALQEVERNWRPQEYPDQALRLAGLLPEHDWVYGAAVDLSGGANGARRQIGNMILSRAPIISVRNLPLLSQSVEGAVNDTQAVLEAVTAGLRVYNLHLNYLSPALRLEQLGTLLPFIGAAPRRGGLVTMPGRTSLGPEDEWIVLPDGAAPPMPEEAMLLGDFNCGPGGPEHAAIVARGFSNTLAEGMTFPGEDAWLDHIFLSPELAPRLASSWIDGEADGSDHQPVWAELAGV